jgi:hypothetical protein
MYDEKGNDITPKRKMDNYTPVQQKWLGNYGVKSSFSNLPNIAPRPQLMKSAEMIKPMTGRTNITVNGTFKVENGNLVPVVTDVEQTVVSMNR